MAFLTGSKQADADEAGKNTVFFFELLQRNVLVTGANGQLGKELQFLTDIDPNDNFKFFFADSSMLDITDAAAVDEYVKHNSIRYIVNCAAYTAVDKAEDDADRCFAVNRDGVANLGKAAAKHNAKVIHVSTDYVFDGTATIPYTEDMPTSPQSVYGKSKREGEIALLEACPDSIIIRTSWLYSQFGNNFVKTMLKLGRERSELNVVADQTGTPTNAADLAAAIAKILHYSVANDFKSGIYHYSNEGVTTWYDFTKAIHREAGIETCEVKPITTDQYPTRATRPKYSVLDKTKIKAAFGIAIPHWQTSLAVCVQSILKEED